MLQNIDRIFSNWYGESLIKVFFFFAVYFGTFTVQHLKEEKLVNIRVKQKPFTIM